MKKYLLLLACFLLAGAATVTAPNYIEELAVGGGYGDTDGGATFDRQGNIDTTGQVRLGDGDGKSGRLVLRGDGSTTPGSLTIYSDDDLFYWTVNSDSSDRFYWTHSGDPINPPMRLTTGGNLSISGTYQVNGTSISLVPSGSTVGQVLRVTGADTYGWGAVDLADTDAVTGTLPVGNGGTGTTTNTSNGVLIGNGSSAITATAEGATNTVLTGVTGNDPVFSASPRINSLGIGTNAGATTGTITATATVSNPTSNQVQTNSTFLGSITADATNSFFAGNFDARLDQAGFNQTAGGPTGIQARARATGASGTVTTARALYADAQNTGAGALTTATAITAGGATNSGGGTITTAIGLEVQNQSVGSNNRGVWLRQSTTGSNNYAIYQDGAAVKNYFGGYVGIGTTTPAMALEVVGDTSHTGQTTNTSSTYPPLRVVRTTATTNSPLGSQALQLDLTSGSMADGFGPLLIFEGDGANALGAVGAVRAGADTTGAVVIRPVTTGSQSEAARWTGTQFTIPSGVDVAFNSDDLTTSQTTFNLLDTTATTLNIGRDATTVNIGETAASGQVYTIGADGARFEFRRTGGSTPANIVIGSAGGSSGQTYGSAIGIQGSQILFQLDSSPTDTSNNRATAAAITSTGLDVEGTIVAGSSNGAITDATGNLLSAKLDDTPVDGLFGTTISSVATEFSTGSTTAVQLGTGVAVNIAKTLSEVIVEYEVKSENLEDSTYYVVLATTNTGSTNASGVEIVSGYFSDSGTMRTLTGLSLVESTSTYKKQRAHFKATRLTAGTYYVNIFGSNVDGPTSDAFVRNVNIYGN